MNKEMIKLHYFYKMGKLDNIIKEKRELLDNNEIYQKSFNVLIMKHYKELKLPLETENIVHKIICDKYFNSNFNETVVINFTDIFKSLKSYCENSNTKKYKANSKDEARKMVKNEMDKFKKNISEERKEPLVFTTEDRIVLEKKKYDRFIKLNCYYIVIAYLLELGLDIINTFFPLNENGLPSLDLLIKVINIVLEKEYEVVKISSIGTYRTLDQYGIVKDLKIKYLTKKLESLGVMVEEEIQKDRVEDKLYNVASILDKKDYLFFRYDSNLYITRTSEESTKETRDSEKLRTDFTNAIKFSKDMDKEILGIKVKYKRFDQYIDDVNMFTDYIKDRSKNHINIEKFDKLRKGLSDYTGLEEIMKIKYK